MKEKIKKSEMTRFAKDCAYAHEKAIRYLCKSEEISKCRIGKRLLDGDEAVLVEISKRFAKYSKEEMNVDLDNSETQNCQDILNTIIDCCEENNWFK